MPGEYKQDELLDEELANILKAADEQGPIEFPFSLEAIRIPVQLGDLQDPELAYNLYHGTIQKLLKKYLPKGKKYAEVRKSLRGEVGLYLKEGHRTGRDGKMAYTPRMQRVAQVIVDWVNDYGGKNYTDLFIRLRSLNEGKQ